MKTAKITSTIVLITAIVIIINVLSENYSFRLDFTEGTTARAATSAAVSIPGQMCWIGIRGLGLRLISSI